MLQTREMSAHRDWWTRVRSSYIMPRRATSSKVSHRQTSTHTLREENKQCELEELGFLYFKYTKLFEDHAMVLRQDTQESAAAYARVVLAETLKEQEGIPLASCRSPEQIQLYLHELARRCEIEPRSFDDRFRICFSAASYVRIMMDSVAAAPNRPHSDLLAVTAIDSQLLREHYTKKPSPTPKFAPGRVNLIPKEPVTRLVTHSRVLARKSGRPRWQGFVTTDEMMRGAFVVSDCAIKKVKGAQYDVLYEDLDDVEVIDLDTLLELVADCELVTNM